MKKYETGHEEVDYFLKKKKRKSKNNTSSYPYRVCMTGLLGSKPWPYGKYEDLKTAEKILQKLRRSWPSPQRNPDEAWIEKFENNKWNKL